MVQYKKIREEDIPLLQQLAADSWQAAYSDILSQDQIEYMLNTMYSTAEIKIQLQNPNYHYYFICEHEDDCQGFIGFENHYEEKTTKLHRIYLIEKAKRRGLGKQALKFLKEQTKNAGDTRIILNVNKENPAKVFYLLNDFRVFDQGVFDIGNGFVMDDFLMECRV